MNDAIEHWQVSKQAVHSRQGVVAAQHHLAARAGAAMLYEGGNAIDAAVACAFALAAVEPWMCGLGGSGYAVIWKAETRTAHLIDFQGVLPAAITPDDYPLDPSIPASIMGFPGVAGRRNVIGYGSITVPGAVAGLSSALGVHGTLEFASVLEPAITLAARGLPTDWFTTLQIALAAADLGADPAAAAIYLPDGNPLLPERLSPLGPLSDTLRALAHEGASSFYEGSLAASLCRDLERGGSRIRRADLAGYRALELEPLAGQHRGVMLHTAGETSGGPRLIDMLAHVERHLEPGRPRDGTAWKIYADALNLAWRRHKERTGRASDQGGCTSHLSAVDRDGNMAAITYTLLNRFGSCVVLPETGILMNNAVSYFDPRAGFPTSMAGGMRINASNMCPTIATRDGEALFAIGASGANHIMPCTAQIAALMLDFGLSLEDAVNHPRIDASDRGSIRVDPRLGPGVIEELALHFTVETAQRLVFPKLYACPSGVARDPRTGLCSGINDPSQPIGAAVVASAFPDLHAVPAAALPARP